MSIWNKIFGATGGASGFLKAGKELIDEAFTSKEEKAEAYQKLFDASIADRVNARDMYIHDSWLQKVYALVFLVAYIGLTAYMIYMIVTLSRTDVEISEFGNTLISSIWGGMTTKVSTITDFLFGSSNGSRSKDILNAKKMKK